MKQDKHSVVVVAPGEGKTLPRPDTGGAVTIKLSSAATGGAITVWESVRPAGDRRGPGLHSHPRFDEIFYVLGGEYQFLAGGEEFAAPSGTLVFVPRGIFHTFANTDAGEGRLLSLAVPGGVEDFFEEMAFADDEARPEAVGRKHGILFPEAAG